MPTLKLHVGGMRGSADEERVEAALLAQAGVFGAAANHQDGCAEVEYEDDEVGLDRLLEIVRAAGFEVELAG